MAITITQERKKQRYLILAAALIIFITIFVIWQGFSRREKAGSAPLAAPTAYVLPRIDIDFKFLENFNAKTLQPFKEISGFQGKFGRENPFTPY
ncbi:MAG: hypothetical protein HYW69_01075 [Candidatus Nealsonbacteria bacterium]|nr:hypothetical protein [Candidatus Nealsonbacteria bacterium]